MTSTPAAGYAARLEVDYPDRDLDRQSTFFRLFYLIPIVTVVVLLGNITLFFPTLLMILFRQKYPQWWFDFNRELARLNARIQAYGAMISDEYPSTTEEQYVHLELDYPDAKSLNRFAPLWKWFLAIPHYLVLIVLGLASVIALIVAWFIILFTKRYPEGIYSLIVGVMRWGLRVNAYAFLLITDEYPPFSLD